LSPETRLAGRVALRHDLAGQALDKVAALLGYKREEAAAGILRIMRANMAGAIRLVSVKRGHDPREFALVAFGGAGPLHAVELARELGIPEVIVPYYPGLGSALGVLFVEVRHDFVQSIFATNTRFDVATINQAFAKLEAEGIERLHREGVMADRMRLSRLFDVRYYGQVSGALTLPIKPGTLNEADVRDIFSLFHKRHAEEYGYTLPEDIAELELVNVRVSAEGLHETPPKPVYPKPPEATPKPVVLRSVYFEDTGWIETPIWRRETLPMGLAIEGPAIIEQDDTTTLLVPGSRATVDSQLNLLCTIG
jgi:N-methylhydantoinase A